jgi:hypothetical protein
MLWPESIQCSGRNPSSENFFSFGSSKGIH